MSIFKSYKSIYEETAAKLAISEKQATELDAKVTALEATVKELTANAKQLISQEDLDKLMSEHAEYSKKNTEYVAVIEQMKKDKVDLDAQVAKETAKIVASQGIPEVPLTVDDSDRNVKTYTLPSGVKIEMKRFSK